MNMIRIFLFLILWIPFIAEAASLQWKELSPGLEYTHVNQKIHAFRINLNDYKLSLVLAKNKKKNSIFVNELANNPKILIAINGGFFMPNFHPLGLRISNKKTLQSIKNTSWWGVFMVQGNKAKIVSRQNFKPSPTINFAIQAGPRLIINGKVPKLKGGVAQRSALGITRDGKVIIAITQNLPLTTNEFANILKTPESQGGLACYNALNLDGGTSSQLYAHVGSFLLNLRSVRPVSDVIVVTRK